ncbi:MAG: PAS domain-containing protein, partial [Alphaproteobacteria bacterium]
MVPVKDHADPNPTVRLLGLAFAGADLVFEVSNQSEITFALGAAERLTGFSDTALVGKRWQELVADDDSDLLTALLNGLQAGERQGPLRVTLKSQNPNLPSKFGALSVFRLPQLGDRVSCALSLGAPGGMDQVGSQSGALMSTDDFSTAATQMLAEADRAGLALRLDLVEMTGLQASLAHLPPEAAEKARQRMAATLRADSYAGLGGAEISQDRFALVRPMSSSNERLEERLGQATGVAIKPTTTKLSLTAGSVSQNMRAMRY